MHIYVHIHKCICICICTYVYIYLHNSCISFFAMGAIANLSWVLREHRAGCRFHPPSCPFAELAALLLARCQPVRLRNPSKSTLAHDAFAAVVLHKHHLIIRVGVGLIQFVYGSHSRMAADLTLDQNLFSQPFSRDLDCILPHLPLFNIFFGNHGSLCCNLCPCAQSKPACTLQYATWTWVPMWELNDEICEQNFLHINICSPFLASKIAIWQLQRDALYIFEKNSSWETAWLVSDWSSIVFWRRPQKKIEFFWNIPNKSCKHRHFTRQIVFSRNHLVPILSNFWNPKFLSSDWLDLKLIFKPWKSWNRNMQVNFLESKHFPSPFCCENRTLPVTWFLEFDLLFHNTASNSITSETHTSGAQ